MPLAWTLPPWQTLRPTGSPLTPRGPPALYHAADAAPATISCCMLPFCSMSVRRRRTVWLRWDRAVFVLRRAQPCFPDRQGPGLQSDLLQLVPVRSHRSCRALAARPAQGCCSSGGFPSRPDAHATWFSDSLGSPLAAPCRRAACCPLRRRRRRCGAPAVIVWAMGDGWSSSHCHADVAGAAFGLTTLAFSSAGGDWFAALFRCGMLPVSSFPPTLHRRTELLTLPRPPFFPAAAPAWYRHELPVFAVALARPLGSGPFATGNPAMTHRLTSRNLVLPAPAGRCGIRPGTLTRSGRADRSLARFRG